ncbi:MAG: RnfH family protein [Proteobacteria bacterium]|nr:RnfH family protein [Pseudomonadota bacterium]
MPEYIDIEVAYARPGKQLIVPLNVPVGTTIEKAIALSRIAQKFTEIDPGKLVVGIFGKRAKLDHRLADGERIEIYRPLKADPREIRRQLAAQGKTMGKARKTDQ